MAKSFISDVRDIRKYGTKHHFSRLDVYYDPVN